MEHLEADGEKFSGAASRGYSGTTLRVLDPENPDYSIDLSDNALSDELEDDHECQEDEHYEFEEDNMNVEF